MAKMRKEITIETHEVWIVRVDPSRHGDTSNDPDESGATAAAIVAGLLPNPAESPDGEEGEKLYEE